MNRKTGRLLIVTLFCLSFRFFSAWTVDYPTDFDGYFHVLTGWSGVADEFFYSDVVWNYIDLPESIPFYAFRYWRPFSSLAAFTSFRIFGFGFRVAQLPFILISCLFPLTAYKIARLLFPKHASIHAAVAWMTAFGGAYAVFFTLPETYAPFALFSALSLYYLAKTASLEIKQSRHFFLGCLFAFLTTTVRTDGWVFVLCSLLYGTVLSRKKQLKWNRTITGFLAAGLCIHVPLAAFLNIKTPPSPTVRQRRASPEITSNVSEIGNLHESSPKNQMSHPFELPKKLQTITRVFLITEYSQIYDPGTADLSFNDIRPSDLPDLVAVRIAALFKIILFYGFLLQFWGVPGFIAGMFQLRKKRTVQPFLMAFMLYSASICLAAPSFVEYGTCLRSNGGIMFFMWSIALYGWFKIGVEVSRRFPSRKAMKNENLVCRSAVAVSLILSIGFILQTHYDPRNRTIYDSPGIQRRLEKLISKDQITACREPFAFRYFTGCPAVIFPVNGAPGIKQLMSRYDLKGICLTPGDPEMFYDVVEELDFLDLKLDYKGVRYYAIE